MGLYDFTFYDLINRNAKSFKNEPMWFEADDNRQISFSQFKESADKLACGLQRSGIKKGDRVAVIGKNSYEFFLLYGAASVIGAIILPINWRLSAEEISFNLNDCEPKIIFADKEYQESVDQIKDKLTSVKSYYNLELNEGNYNDIRPLSENNGDVKHEELSTDDPFVIIHTAAVEGKPRGAVISHGNLLCANVHFNYHLNIFNNDVHLNLLPLFHVGGLFMATNAFHAGALNVNMSKFDAKKAMELIESKNVTVMFDFSPILSSIMDEHKESGKIIKSLSKVIGLDSPENIEKYQELTGGTFYCMYGQTETSCLATLGKYNDMPGSAGQVIQLAEVRLVDEYGEIVPVNSVGEITMKGPMIFKGYWNLKEENEYAFRNGWHHTGDLGKFDDKGYLWYSGRKPEKELIKPGGENVYPAEVEKVILEHSAVKKTAVFGVPDPKWKEGIKAVCLLKEGEKLDPSDLISFVGERIASYKKPQYVEFTTEFPTLENGSPDRVKIKELFGG